MVFLHVGLGDRAALGVRVDQQDLPAAAAAWEASLMEPLSQLVCDERRPRPKPGAVTAATGWSKRWGVVEVAAAFGGTFPALGAVAVAALRAAFDLGRGPLQAGPKPRRPRSRSPSACRLRGSS